MTVDEKFMCRCIQLASKGKGYTNPNPLVGAVVVYNNKIIGEGFHRKYGEGHAEVNAINSVKDKSLLSQSTIYVSLESCSHYGKTPPCAQLIIASKIPKVVIGCSDPFPKVSGRGIEMLKQAGVETVVGVLEQECKYLNREFNTAHSLNRPYIYLKWAQTADGFIDKLRINENQQAARISNDFTSLVVHKLRAEVAAIMLATNTAILDNPSLTTRLWKGSNSVRVLLDRNLRVPNTQKLLDSKVRTLVFTEREGENRTNVEYFKINFESEDHLLHIFKILKKENLNSVLIEGGSQFLQSLINANLWDEAFVETSSTDFVTGVLAPKIEGIIQKESFWGGSKQTHFYHSQV